MRSLWDVPCACSQCATLHSVRTRLSLVAIYLLYNLVCVLPHVHATTPVKTHPCWPLRLGYLCSGGIGGYYIRLLSQKIILPCGLLGFSLCICQLGSYAVTQRMGAVWIHTKYTLLFFTHSSGFLIKTTKNNWRSTSACRTVFVVEGRTSADQKKNVLVF